MNERSYFNRIENKPITFENFDDMRQLDIQNT